MKTETKEFSLKRRWAMAALVYLVMLVAFCNQFKAPPLFTTLIPELGFSGTTIGLMMSMFSFLGLILAFPAALIIGKIGIRKTLLITAVGVGLGSLLGAFAQEPNLMLFSRVIEGSGVGLLSVVAPSALAVLIPKTRRGLAYGIQGITFPAGTVVAMNISPAINAAFGWRTVWIAGCLIAFVACALVFVFFRLSHEDDKPRSPAKAAAQAGISLQVLPKPDYRSIVVTGIVFMLWNFIWTGAFNSFYPTFLQQEHGLTQVNASFIVSITSLIMLFLGPLSGIISDKLGTRKWLIVFAMAGSAVMFAFGWNESIALVWVFIIGESIFAPCIGTGVMSIVPGLARHPDKVGVGMATISFFKCIGMIVGSAVYGSVVAALGWFNASLLLLVPLAVLGALLATALIREKRSSGSKP